MAHPPAPQLHKAPGDVSGGAPRLIPKTEKSRRVSREPHSGQSTAASEERTRRSNRRSHRPQRYS